MHQDARRYRELVEEHGFSMTHEQVIRWVPGGARVLEIGCASGFIGERLIVQKGCRVVGAEVDAGAASEASQRGVEVRIGSVEDPAFRVALGDGYDIVIAADVLEHMANPEPVLDHMRCWLKSDGRAIVAVPNIAVWSMRMTLLRGRFDYTDTGLLDRTHLRFFTWDTFHALLRDHGWRVEDTMVEGWELPGTLTIREVLPMSLRARLGLLASKLGPLKPNLCAGHLALLIAPGPAGTPRAPGGR